MLKLKNTACFVNCACKFITYLLLRDCSCPQFEPFSTLCLFELKSEERHLNHLLKGQLGLPSSAVEVEVKEPLTLEVEEGVEGPLALEVEGVVEVR